MPTLHQISLGGCFSTNRCCFSWKGLRRRSLYATVLRYRVDEVNHDVSENYIGKGRKSSELVDSIKFLNSSTSSSEGPYVRNDENVNNKTLQRLCNNGKLTTATILVDIMADT
ncbi:hypothetical protein RYX36_004199 [Vicia faba]